MSIEDIKSFLYIDGSSEDILVGNLQLGAEIYLTNTGIIKDYTNDLYILVIKMLTYHWYNNRESFVNIKSTKLDFSIESMIYNLKYSQIPVVVVTP